MSRDGHNGMPRSGTGSPGWLNKRQSSTAWDWGRAPCWRLVDWLGCPIGRDGRLSKGAKVHSVLVWVELRQYRQRGASRALPVKA